MTASPCEAPTAAAERAALGVAREIDLPNGGTPSAPGASEMARATGPQYFLAAINVFVDLHQRTGYAGVPV